MLRPPTRTASWTPSSSCAAPTSTRFDHVNNAVYWQAVEELLADHEHPGGGRLVDNPHRAVLEYLSPIVSTDRIVLRSRRDDTSLTVWFLVDDALRAVARVGPLTT